MNDKSKKNNMAYWDEIDDECYECVRQILSMSDTSTVPVEDDDIEDDIIVPIGAEIRDIVISGLKEKGYEFPFVDADY